jgi:dTDP-4-dehydrorhamnose 3,5-epimerase
MYSSSEIKRFPIAGPVLITPKAHGDGRGLFSETYRADEFNKIIGAEVKFLQDNLSVSVNAGTVRGLHAQKPPYAIGKLVQCVRGSIVDIAVDVRKGSPTFGENVRAVLSAENRSQLWVPVGFLHGYATACADTAVFYKQTGYYAPDGEISVRWDDPDLALDWGFGENDVVLSDKDTEAQSFADFNSPFVVS